VRKISKRKVAATIAISAILIGGGGAAAIAYWSAGGSGTGTATTGTSSNITVLQSSTISNLAPGAPVQALSGTFSNSNADPVFVTSITASIASVTVGGVAVTGCSGDDYTLDGATVTIGATVDTGTTWTGPTIEFKNKPLVDQNACKGATVNIAYSVS
jgi:hypothetical protein